MNTLSRGVWSFSLRTQVFLPQQFPFICARRFRFDLLFGHGSTIEPIAILTVQEVHSEMIDAGMILDNIKLIEIDMMEPIEREFSSYSSASEDIALLQHSSGTTGLKKGVSLTNKAIALHSERYGSALAIGKGDSVASWLPLYHDMGLMACMVMPAYHGVPIVQMDPFDWTGDPRSFLEMIERNNTTLWIVTTKIKSYFWLFKNFN